MKNYLIHYKYVKYNQQIEGNIALENKEENKEEIKVNDIEEIRKIIKIVKNYQKNKA